MKQGYPLEMKVAAALRNEDFYVNQSPYYNDPETNISREIDVIATKGDHLGFLEVALVIECKTSIDKPWVLFTSERHEEGRNKLFTFGILSNIAREKIVDKSWPAQALKQEFDLIWLNKPDRTAFGVTSAFSSGEDAAYKAVVGALKASIDWSLPKEQNPPLKFIFPVIVLEGSLFEAYLGQDGETIVEEVDEGFITNHRSISGIYCSSVHIVTTKKLSSFCREAAELTSQLNTLLQPDIDVMWEELRQK